MSRTHAALLAGVLAFTALSPRESGAQHYTIDFDDLSGGGLEIPSTYGSTEDMPIRIWASNGVDFLDAAPPRLWLTRNADLVNVAFVDVGRRLVIHINVQRDARRVRLHSFQVGAFVATAAMNWRVYDGEGNLLAGPESVQAPATTARTIYPNVASTGSGLILVVGGDAYNGGTDNIRFTVSDSLFDDGFEASARP